MGLNDQTKGSFTKWLENRSGDLLNMMILLIILSYLIILRKEIGLLVSMRVLLKNTTNQDEGTQMTFVASDAIHNLISCEFRFSTHATCTMKQGIADIGYLIHGRRLQELFLCI